MSSHTEPTEAGERYTAAHETQYTGKDSRAALRLYQALLSDFPESQEAGYSQVQIQNIVRAVVPIEMLIEAQAELAWHFLEESVDESNVVEMASPSAQQSASPAPVHGD